MKKLFAILLCLTMFIVSAPAVFAAEEDEELTVVETYVDDPNAGRYTYTAEGLVYDTWNDYLYEVDEGHTAEEIDYYAFTNDGEFLNYGYNGTTEVVEDVVTEDNIQVSSGNQISDEDPIEAGEPEGEVEGDNPTTSNELPIALGFVAAVAVACIAKRKLSE